MRKIIILLAFVATPAMAQTSQFYGSDGDYLGTMQPAGQNNFIYGRDGDYIGSTAPAGKDTYVYDGQGNYVGAVINSGPRSRN
jgi:YD repeat-containing protein